VIGNEKEYNVLAAYRRPCQEEVLTQKKRIKKRITHKIPKSLTVRDESRGNGLRIKFPRQKTTKIRGTVPTKWWKVLTGKVKKTNVKGENPTCCHEYHGYYYF